MPPVLDAHGIFRGKLIRGLPRLCRDFSSVASSSPSRFRSPLTTHPLTPFRLRKILPQALLSSSHVSIRHHPNTPCDHRTSRPIAWTTVCVLLTLTSSRTRYARGQCIVSIIRVYAGLVTTNGHVAMQYLSRGPSPVATGGLYDLVVSRWTSFTNRLCILDSSYRFSRAQFFRTILPTSLSPLIYDLTALAKTITLKPTPRVRVWLATESPTEGPDCTQAVLSACHMIAKRLYASIRKLFASPCGNSTGSLRIILSLLLFAESGV